MRRHFYTDINIMKWIWLAIDIVAVLNFIMFFIGIAPLMLLCIVAILHVIIKYLLYPYWCAKYNFDVDYFKYIAHSDYVYEKGKIQ